VTKEKEMKSHGPVLMLNVDVRNIGHDMGLHIWEQYCSKYDK
jgi:hypothetical protein